MGGAHSDPRHALGLIGERQAERFLRARGMKTIARRFATPVGEIDLVCREGRTLVFVEVKTRRDDDYSAPEDAVSAEKQKKLLRAARWYTAQKRQENAPCRFDIVSVILPTAGEPRIRHIEDAFT